MTTTPTTVTSMHPRPDRARQDWKGLDGAWQFTADPAGTLEGPADAAATGWPEMVIVPFSWETPASGLHHYWLETGWYRRTVTVSPNWLNERLYLCFGAVHHEVQVWVNGTHVGGHTGGMTPFELDITEAVGGHRDVEVIARVHAPHDKRGIVHGKQRSIPRDDYDGVSFTPTSGIWQSVWLEPRPATHALSVRLKPGPQLDRIDAHVRLSNPPASDTAVRLSLVENGTAVDAIPHGDTWYASLPIDQPRLWSPESPNLYHVEVMVESSEGTDHVLTYTGLRCVDTDGERLLLNGSPVYLRGVLDQGYWPETGMTPPSAEALRRDLELARSMGYNCVRKHLKLEDPRWLYWADTLGMLVWAEPASTSRFNPESVESFDRQIPAMVERDGNHPSIVVWSLYNEEWGLDWDVASDPAKQDTLRRSYDMLKSLDDSRPVVDNSGWTHVRTDLVDWHVYDDDPASWARTVEGLANGTSDRFSVRLGPDLVVDKALAAGDGDLTGRPFLNSEYGGGFTSLERAWHLRWQTQELRRHNRIAGYVYTELYDIEHEFAGLLTSDRRNKDLGGLNPADINATTVLVIDCVPRQAGIDLTTTADTPTSFAVRVSHHGTDLISGHIRASWAPSMSPWPTAPPQADTSSELIHAKPFILSEATHLELAMPNDMRTARLLLWLDTDEGPIARNFLDVAAIDGDLDARYR